MISEPWACTDRLKKLAAAVPAAALATKLLLPIWPFLDVSLDGEDSAADFRSMLMEGITR
jgi:hypothetical protein